jgi:hypothetical protein
VREQAFGEVALALLREGVAIRFRASGLSMEPSIRDGDVITVAPLEAAVRRGDVLLYRHGRRFTAHRAIGRVRGDATLLRVRGDAPGWEEERVAVADVLGRIVAVEREGRKVRPRGALARRAASLVHRFRRRLRRARASARPR